MAVNLSIKGVPDALADRLRARAADNRRSLQRELMLIIESAVATPDSFGGRGTSGAPRGGTVARLDQSSQEGRPVEDVVAELHKLFPRVRHRGPSSADIIREMRNGHYDGGTGLARRHVRPG